MKNKTIKAVVATLILTMTFTACGNTESVSEPQVVEDTAEVEATVEDTVTTENVVEEVAEELTEETVDVADEVVAEDETSNTEEPEAVEEEPQEEAVVEEVTEEVVEEPEEEAVVYTYTDMTATKFAKSSVNVRDLPSKDGNKIGSLSTNTEVAVTGKCNETGWFRFELNGQIAYVSNAYLVDEKVVIEEKPVAEAPAEVPSNTPVQTADHEYYKWYDKGAYFIAYVPKNESCPEEWRGYQAPGFQEAYDTIAARYAGTERNRIDKGLWKSPSEKGIRLYIVEATTYDASVDKVYFYSDGGIYREVGLKENVIYVN